MVQSGTIASTLHHLLNSLANVLDDVDIAIIPGAMARNSAAILTQILKLHFNKQEKSQHIMAYANLNDFMAWRFTPLADPRSTCSQQPHGPFRLVGFHQGNVQRIDPSQPENFEDF